MKSYSQLSELRDELAFLRLSLQVLLSEESLDLHSPRSLRCRSIRRRIARLKIAIRVHQQLSSWRKENVYVVARSLIEAKAFMRVLGWPDRSSAQKHLEIVKASSSYIGNSWVAALSYRIFKLKRFRRINKDEFISSLISTRK